MATQTRISEAYKRIKQLLFQQKLAPGQRLVYDDLCKMFNMSRTPIINALNRLEQEGFVASESFRGFYVKPLDLKELWDAFGIREALETYAVEHAIKLCSDGDIDILEQAYLNHEQYRPHYYNNKRFLLDAQFHIQIAIMAKNRVLKYLLRNNLEHIYLRFRLDNYDPRRMAPAAREHHRLVERIKNRDILGGIELIRNHVHTARDYVIRCLTDEDINH